MHRQHCAIRSLITAIIRANPALRCTIDKSGTTLRTIASDGPQRPGGRPACVIVIHGKDLGRRLDVTTTPMLVGRAAEADLYIPHVSVSRRHCQVWRSGDSYFLSDLGATNPTRINDSAVGSEKTMLRDGDHITVGETILKFISHTSVEALYHEEIYQLATHDPLTNLCNRRHFMEQLNTEIARAQRYQRPLTLCMIDVDLFKPVNDEFGHAEGDEVLRIIASLLREHARIEDVAARIGGEEFSVLFPETAMDAAQIYAERLRKAVAKTPFTPGGRERQITISIGVARIDLARRDNNASQLLERADTALYAAKANGRNCVVSSTD